MSQDEVELLEVLLAKARVKLTTKDGLSPQYITVYSGKLEGDTWHVYSGRLLNHHLDDKGNVVLVDTLILE